MKIFAYLVLGLLVYPVHATNKYVCDIKVVTQITYNSDSSESEGRVFNISNGSLTVEKVNNSNYVWAVTYDGQSAPFLFCKHDFGDYGNVFCRSNSLPYEIFEMNNQTLRYFRFQQGYVVSKEEQNAQIKSRMMPTLTTEAGECRAFDK